MNRWLLIAFLIVGYGFSATESAAQKLVYGGKPKPQKAGKIESYYAEFPNKIRVYKVQNDTDEDRLIYFEIRDQGGKVLGKVDASVNASGGSIDEFHAFYGDLDKNKSAELVVVDFDGQSLGLGVNYYTINIFPDFETKGFTEPLVFNTSEFGRDGTFLYDAKTNETLILLTEWGGVEVKDPKRPGGMYLAGRFFRYRDGKLKPAADKPILARRYLNSFEKERFRTNNDPRRPYHWLSSPQAIKLKNDPVFDEKPASSESGVIEKFEEFVEKTKAEPGEQEHEVPISQIVVRLDSGARKTVVLSKHHYNGNLPEKENRIFAETLGVLPAKLTLPDEFSPLLVFGNLEGKRVRINGYIPGPEWTTPVYKLWFDEN